MEDYGYKYIHKLPQFIKILISRRNCLIDLKPKDVKDPDHPYREPLREYRKPKFKVGDGVRISKYDLPIPKGNKSQFTE